MRKYDLVVWGATSFTGKLVTEYLFNKHRSSKIKWAIAGRNLDKLEKVRSQVADENIPIFIADSFDEKSTREFLMSHIFQDKYIYHHHWKSGDFVFMD